MISIILPTYNERLNIVDLVKAINQTVKPKKEIIVIDDNSPDGTAKAVNDLIKTNQIKNLRLHVRKKNRGLTNSLKKGIELAKGDTVVWLDADFSHPPPIIPKLLKKIDQGFDIAIASRFIKGGGYKKNLQDSNDSWLAVSLSRLMNYTIQLLLDQRFKDYSSGFIAIKKKVLKKIKLHGDYGEYFMDLMVRAILANYQFIEIPFINLPRKRGKSKTGGNLWQLIKRGFSYLLFALKLSLLRIKFYLHLTHDFTL